MIPISYQLPDHPIRNLIKFTQNQMKQETNFQRYVICGQIRSAIEALFRLNEVGLVTAFEIL